MTAVALNKQPVLPENLAVNLARSRVFGLDVLRALAIATVVYGHCGDMVASVGHVFFPPLLDGVELFFVLSGFLIGGLLIEIAEYQPTPLAWLMFMVRRWMRTLPAYFVVGIATLVPSSHIEHKIDHAVTYGLLLQNFAWPMPEDNWFAVSWSLTIEEWFYLLFSVVFLLSARFLGRRGQWLAISIFLILPLLARFATPVALPWDLYVRKIVVLRLDAIAYGVVLARAFADRSVFFGAWKLTLAVGVTILGGVWNGLFPLDGIALRSIYPCIGAMGWALCFPAALRLAQASGLLGRFIVRVSQQSYVIYLIHLPLLSLFMRPAINGSLPWQLSVLGALVTIWVISFISLRFFEGPILALRPRQWNFVQTTQTPPDRLAAIGSLRRRDADP